MEISEKKKKFLLYTTTEDSLLVKVPKTRGEGFLKTPYGHHANEALDNICDSLSPFGIQNVFGLDGFLNFTGVYPYKFPDTESAAKCAMPQLGVHYKLSFKRVGLNEFMKV